ncbi:MAG: DUF1643 domain-containing protein [Polyangiaceae bacterium]
MPRPRPAAGAVVKGDYRYLLWRTFGSPGGRLLFVMLNPSTADASWDDPTVRRCIRFGAALGYGSLEICNLFALRATDPREILQHDDPIGPENDSHIRDALSRASTVVAAWGALARHSRIARRVLQVREMLACKHEVHALALTKFGCPRHPLYLPRSQTLTPYNAIVRSPT